MNTSRITRLVLIAGLLMAFITACNTSDPQPVFPAPHIESATLEEGVVTIIGTNLFRAEPVDAFPQDLAITGCGQALADIHVVGTTQTITLEGGKTVTITRAGTITGSMTGDPAGDSLTLTNPDGQGVTAAIECAPSPEPEPKPGALVLDIDLQYAAGTTFKLPFQADGTVTIHWGDGVVEEFIDPAGETHEYAEVGAYTIHVSGDATDARFAHWLGDHSSAKGIVALHSWGDFPYRIDGIEGAFYQAHNVAKVPDQLPAGVTSLAQVFFKAAIFNQDISTWDTSRITNMDSMFYGAEAFSQDLSEWCVVYTDEKPVDFDINAGGFSEDLHPEWGRNCNEHALVMQIDTRLIDAASFTLGLETEGFSTIDWGDGIVEEVAPPRSTTHEYAAPGVYIITVTGDLTDVRLGHDTWSPVSSETLIKLHSWGDFAYREDGLLAAFEGAKNLVAVPDALPEGITTLEGLFNKAESFNGDISGWDVSKARNMQFMFLDAGNFDQDLSDWCVRYILTEPLSFSKDAGFAGNENFQPLWGMNCGGPDLVIEIQIPDLDGYYLLPFEATGTATIDWGNGEVETFTNPFAQPHTYFREGTYKITVSGELTDVRFGARVLGFSQENLIAVHSWGHFDYATRALGQAFSGAINVTSVPDHLPPGIVFLPLAFRGAASFNGDISNWDVSEITDMERMFEDARSFNQDLSGWCVEQIDPAPTDFALRTSFDFEYNNELHPNWGARCKN